MQDKSFFTIKEAANILGCSEDGVFELMRPGRVGISLAPAYVVETPVAAKELGVKGGRIKVGPGVFEIGVRPYENPCGCKIQEIQWDEHNMAMFNLLVSYELYEEPRNIEPVIWRPDENRRTLAYGQLSEHPVDTLFRGESPDWKFELFDHAWMRKRSYVIESDPIPVSRSEIVILRDRLVAYMTAKGKAIPPSNTESVEMPLPSQSANSTHTEDDLANSGSRRGDLLSEEIEAAIEELGGNYSPKKVMRTLKGYAGKGGSCILRNTSDGFTWRDQWGKEKHFDLEALRKRLGRRNRTISGR